MDAEREAERATRERRALEERRGRWLPGRRRELEGAREREEDAVARLREARRVEAELRHGTRRFVTRGEIEARTRCGSGADRGAGDRAGASRPDTGGSAEMPKTPPRPMQPVPRYTLTRKEAAASLGISLNHFER